MLQSLFKTAAGLTEGVGPRSTFHLLAGYGGAERRLKPRIEGPFPTVAHGVDARGETFEVYTMIDNISARGLYLQLTQRLEPGTTLFLVTSLSTSGSLQELAPRLALQGVVLRSELKSGGACGAAVMFSHHRFL